MVIGIPKEFLVTTVWNLVINHLGGAGDATPGTHHAERVLYQVRPCVTAPLARVAASVRARSRSVNVVSPLLLKRGAMCRALLAGAHYLTATWLRAEACCLAWHALVFGDCPRLEMPRVLLE